MSGKPKERTLAAIRAVLADRDQWTVKSTKKPRGRPFEPGVSGNPDGRPKGSRNRVTIWRERFRAEDVEAASQAVLAAARNGDRAALTLMIKPFLPRPRQRPIDFELPPMTTVEEVADAMAEVLARISSGDLAIDEAERLTRIIDRQLRILLAQERER